MSETMNIAIDGPAGAGKSTIAKRVAAELGYIYVDTGAMYRAISLYFLKKGASLGEESVIEASLPDVAVEIRYVEGAQRILLNGDDVSEEIRKEEVGNAASKVSAYPAVREKLLSLQRGLAKENDCVMDGRDIGSHVLPDAKVKIYLTANVDTRADRRFRELEQKGESPDLEKIKADIEARDAQDMNRAVAPLRQAESAVYLDSSDLGIEEVAQKIITLARERGAK